MRKVKSNVQKLWMFFIILILYLLLFFKSDPIRAEAYNFGSAAKKTVNYNSNNNVLTSTWWNAGSDNIVETRVQYQSGNKYGTVIGTTYTSGGVPKGSSVTHNYSPPYGGQYYLQFACHSSGGSWSTAQGWTDGWCQSIWIDYFSAHQASLPSAIYANPGDTINAQITITSYGYPYDTSYEWFWKPASGSEYSCGFKGQSYSWTASESDDGGYVYCKLKNSGGTSTTNKCYIYINKLTITKNPQDAYTWTTSNEDGLSIGPTFSCTATGAGTLTYQWQSGTSVNAYVDIPEGNVLWHGASGTKTSSLKLGTENSMDRSWTGNFVRCKVTSTLNGKSITKYTNPACVYVYEPPTAKLSVVSQKGTSVDLKAVTSNPNETFVEPKFFEYTGSIQTYTVPATGTYRLIVWGAQGGASLMDGAVYDGGGTGGYSYGTVKLTKGETLYIGVGGKGGTGVLNGTASGGYNGGGTGTWDGTDNEAAGGGGGATHIAKKNGLLSSLSGSKSSVLIVAGGGGGCSWNLPAGGGGGLNGEAKSTTSSSYPTQSSGYAFGKGENGHGVGNSDGVAGGGGGWYGGYANDVYDKESGTGGSGYIGGVENGYTAGHNVNYGNGRALIFFEDDSGVDLSSWDTWTTENGQDDLIEDFSDNRDYAGTHYYTVYSKDHDDNVTSSYKSRFYVLTQSGYESFLGEIEYYMGFSPKLDSAYPKDVTVTIPVGETYASSDATFSIRIATAGSPANYTYEWYRTTAPNATGEDLYENLNSLTISGEFFWDDDPVYDGITKEDNNTYYYCIVGHSTGEQRTRSAKLNVQYAPTLNASYPKDVTTNSGSTATFSVSISSAGNPASYTYQWYKNGTKISGATGRTYTTPKVSTDDNGAKYHCVVGHIAGEQETRKATLTVNAQKPVLLGPNYSSYKEAVVEGETATFWVQIKTPGIPDDYDYTWQYRPNTSSSWAACSDGWFKSNCSYSSDSNGFTMNITKTTKEMDGYQFRLVVRNENGKYETITNTATLTIYYDPVFVSPSNLIVKEGDTATYTLKITNAGNNPEIAVDWYETTPSGTSTKVKTETGLKTEYTYSFTASRSQNGNTYHCVLRPSKTKSLTSNKASLTVYYPPTLDSNKPADLVLNTGSSGTFETSITTAGNPASYTYQWYYATPSAPSTWNKCTESSATTAKLTITAVTGMNGRTYKCIVSQSASMTGSNKYTASVTSRIATLTVYYPPVLDSTYPKDVTTVAGKAVSFSVKIATAGNPANYTYQWYKKASASTNGVAISGATGATYNIAASAVTKSLNDTYYYCVVTTVSSHSTYGKYTVTSRTAKLTVYYTPVLDSSYPKDLTINAGANASFSVSITTAGNPTSYTYQWYTNTSNSSSGGKVISGATSSTLTLTSVGKEKNGTYYYCVVANAGGEVFSRVAKLTVQYTPVLNTAYPKDITVNAGETASFAVSITTAGNPASYTYQWYKGTTASDAGTAISGATSASYTTPATANADNGTYYYCKVGHVAGTVASRHAKLTVNFLPTLNSSYPADTTIVVGNKGTFEVKISIDGNPASYTYQWYKGTTASDAGTAISGATSASYTTPATTKSDNATYYYCKVTNTRGTVTSRHAKLTVQYVPVLNSSYPADITVTEGNSATFSVSIATAGNPASYTYQWQWSSNGTSWNNCSDATTGTWNGISGSKTANLTLGVSGGKIRRNWNQHKVRCIVTNAAGSVTSRVATLTVRFTPVLDTAYPVDVTVVEGNSASFEVKISSAGNPASYTYKWQWSGDNSTWYDCADATTGTWNGVFGSTTAKLTLGTSGNKIVKGWHGYKVRCVVSNSVGSITSRTATLFTKYKPGLDTKYPEDTTVIVGNKASFKVVISVAGNPASYTYQWYQNGTAISGATSSTYTTGATTKDMNGYTYYCKVSNEAGSVTSRTATLNVQYTPIADSSYPKDITVISGQKATFAISIATAGNPASYTYQWYKGTTASDAGTAISGAKSSSYVIASAAKADDQTYYYCKISNTAGTISTRHAKLTVYYLPVLDSTLPKDVTVVVGATATFNVSVATAGNPASYSYQWYQKGTAINGATNSSYTTGATTSAMNGYTYYCKVTNAAGSVNSRTATLTVYYPPILNSSYPQDATVVIGNKATFSVVVATAGNPNSYTYQWYQNGTLVSGATGSSYTTVSTTKAMNGNTYYCVVKNAGGSVTSRTAKLTVQYPPVLNTAYPADTTVVVGNKATFKVVIATAGNPASYTYQWYKGTTASDAGTAISGATSASYTIPATAKGDNGTYYYCKVTNAGGTVSSRHAKLTVYYAPVLDSSYPQDTTVVTGNTATFSVKISSAGNPASYTYQWYKSDGTAIANATSASYSIVGTKAITGTKYYCVVKNAGGSVTSRTATLYVLYPNELDPLYPKDATVVIGNKATFEVVIAGAGTGSPSYQWYKSTDGKNSGGTAINGATGKSYTTPATTKADNNTYYYCVVSNDGGTSTSRAAKLTVQYPAVLNASYPQDVTTVVGNSASFKVVISEAGNPASYTYQWYKATSASGAGTAISGATSDTYQIKSTTNADNNTYYFCKVTNAGGTAESRHAKLTVYYPPVLNSSYPKDATVIIGNKGSFQVVIATAGNPDSYTYQWYQNGTLLQGATSATYTTAATTKAMNGYTYYCVVTNTGGSVTSRTAKLTVQYPPVLDTTLPQDTVVIEGNSGTFKVGVATAGNPNSYKYQWQWSSDGKTWTNCADGTTGTFNGMFGSTTSVLTLGTSGSKIQRTWNQYKVRCIVTNAGGSVTSRTATMTVHHLPTLDSSYPKDTTVVVGNKGTFEVKITVAGNPSSYTYQWYQNGTSVNGATASSYTTVATTKQMNGYKYYCKVSNAAGTVTSRTATLTVYFPPVLDSTYPQNVTIVVGNSASFKVVVATAGNPESYTYQWYKASSETAAGKAISGATNATYTISKATKDDNETFYYCVVKNAGGSVTSRHARLTTYYTPVLDSSYPKDTEVILGNTATFKVVIATAGNPASYTYQWYDSNGKISGATESSYSAEGTKERDKNTYYCVVTNLGGSVTSRKATLRVWWKAELDKDYPKDVVGIEGNDVSYEVKISVAGNPAEYTYQWFIADEDGATGTAIENATSAVYTITAHRINNDKYYYCEVTNKGGTSRSRHAHTTIYYLPDLDETKPEDVTIIYNPNDSSKNQAEMETVISQAGNPDEYQYQWYVRKTASSGWEDTGVTTAKIALTNLQKSANGYQFYCKVTNKAGSVNSRIATLTVLYTPSLASVSDITIKEFENAKFEVKIATAGNPNSYTYEWLQKDPSSNSWTGITFGKQTGSVLSLSNVPRKYHQFQYRCRVTNSAGTVTSNAATLYILWMPDVALNDTEIANAGYYASYRVQILTEGNPEYYTYKWYEKKAGAKDFMFMPNQGSDLLDLGVVDVEDNGNQYYCEVINAAGTVKTNVMTLDVRFTPVLNEVKDVAVKETEKGTFEVTIKRDGNPTDYTYQWYCNGEVIPGATKSSYTTPAATPEMNESQYYCEVTSTSGTVLSNTATLTVYYKATLSEFHDLAVIEGESLTMKAEISKDGNLPEYTYQWYRNGQAIKGATNETYTLENANRDMHGDKYYYMVTNNAGTTKSREATLTVLHLPTLGKLEDVAVIDGETAKFEIPIATPGRPDTYSYEWYYRRNASEEWTLVEGNNAAVYEFVTNKDMDGWQYYVKVSNDAGFVNSNIATLTVYYTPTVASSGDAIVIEGESASFTASIVKHGNPQIYSYQWYVKGSNEETWQKVPNATSRTYTISNVSRAQHKNQYKCEVHNEAGEVFSAPATLFVYWLPTVNGPNNATVIEGEDTEFSVQPENGNPEIYTYQWYCNGKAIPNATDSSYKVVFATKKMNGDKYYCKVTNAAGTVSSKEATLNVLYGPSLINPTDITVIEGKNGSFKVGIAEDGNPASYQYQWYYREGSRTGWMELTDETKETLNLSNVSRTMNGWQYMCTVTNASGATNSSAATLTVHYLPDIGYPYDYYAIEGDKATFNVAIRSHGNPTDYHFQWQYREDSNSTWKDVTTGTGMHNSSYTTVETTLDMDGYQYQCIVTNSAGTVATKRYATLRVYKQLEIEGPTTVTEGLNLTLSVNDMEGVTFSLSDNSLGKLTEDRDNKKLVLQTYDGHTGDVTLTATRSSNGDEYKVVIHIVKKAITGIKADYIGPDVLTDMNYAKKDVRIIVYYNNGTSDVIFGDNSLVIVNDTLVRNVGDNHYMATYKGFSAEFTVKGLKPSVIGIRIDNPPAQTKYAIGENFSTTGMVVVASYDNGKENIVTDYKVAGSPVVSGQKYVTIVYEEDGTTVTATQSISVYEDTEVIYPGDNGWINFYELYRFENISFRSKTTMDEHPESNGWIDVTQTKATEYKEASIKAGYGFELKVYTNYYTNRSSRVEGTISTNMWEESYVDETSGEKLYNYSTIYPLVTAIKNPDNLYVKIYNRETGEETKFVTNTDDNTFIKMEKTNNPSTVEELNGNETLAATKLESRWDNSTKVFELEEREIYEGNPERKIYTSENLYSAGGSNQYVVTIISPIWYGYDWEAGTDTYGYFVKNYTSKTYSNGAGSLQVCMSFLLNVEANDELHTHILQ